MSSCFCDLPSIIPQILAVVSSINNFPKNFTFSEVFGLTLQSEDMKVRLIEKKTIEKYVVANARSRDPFRHWLSKLKHAEWSCPEDITILFKSADLLGNGCNRVIFDVGGNSYRMICKYHFGLTRVHLYVKWIGSHAEYDKLCDSGQQYSISNY
jgi:mRNA interferase HigB